jgi:selenocysteine lyase/cysteine desulfurase
MHDYDWVNVRGQCHELLIQALRRITDIKGMPPVYPLDDPANSALPPQMGIAPLPGDTDIDTLKNTLYGKYQIEIPCTEWNARKYLRISIQAYNNESDIEMLLTALRNEIGLRSMAGR